MEEGLFQRSLDIDQSQSSYESMEQSEFSLPSNDQSESGIFTSKGDNSDTDEEEKESYYFESDHVALKDNRDYQVLLRTIALLEAQRIQAVHDLDKLYEGRQEALADPIQFVQKLQRGLNLGLPTPQKIAELPKIAWDKYTSTLDFSSFGSHRHMTRLKKQLKEGNGQEPEDVKVKSMTFDGEDKALIRGRIKTEEKPVTFNQLWTAEEQKRLEELLIEFPPEEVESKRFQKIATALGNRTPLQVQSRVQKYFIKLAKAGLPIPGRIPHSVNFKKKIGQRQQPRYNHMYQNSTFLTSFTPPVFMDDDDYSRGYEESVTSATEPWQDDDDDRVSDEEGVPIELRGTREYQELMRLKHLKKMKTRASGLCKTEHVGFKCDSCQCEPIVGTRWHCTDCPPDDAVDFCDNCVESGHETSTHNSSHRLHPKRNAEGFNDTDYMGFMPGGYNYLDPNYMPAT
ncbi:ZZ-type zinc finger-containing protein 3-like [Mya arenaria]|uniref:ZZ-type zinc finger-containing protein 3-like n=1 Tax=Mya arenaria TaxID=6604 RepID=UPI0022E1D4EF|nr:ZZ-type zinc finger-containing protein 3-like [Mya arenaria]XP_052790773.1 ZZ-type zinc finger-containing protein 3-like [Mya arenaria]